MKILIAEDEDDIRRLLALNMKKEGYEVIECKDGIEALEVEEYPCCKREAKIKPIYKMCGSYCPFCGVRYEEY